MTPPDKPAKPEEKPVDAPAPPPSEPKRYYLLVGKTTIKGPFTAKELSAEPDFTDASKLAPLGATKASHWKPAEHFEELRAVLEARKAAAQPAKPPTGRG